MPVVRNYTPDGKLTPKQALFVKKVIEGIPTGKSLTQSALEVYDTDDPLVARNIASENVAKPIIKESIEQAFVENGLGLTTITGNLAKLATKEADKVSADVILRTNVELLKLLGAYPRHGKANLNVNISAKVKDMSFSEAKKALAQLRGKTEGFMEDAE